MRHHQHKTDRDEAAAPRAQVTRHRQAVASSRLSRPRPCGEPGSVPVSARSLGSQSQGCWLCSCSGTGANKWRRRDEVRACPAQGRHGGAQALHALLASPAHSRRARSTPPAVPTQPSRRCPRGPSAPPAHHPRPRVPCPSLLSAATSASVFPR
jgi:hypothetical protein